MKDRRVSASSLPLPAFKQALPVCVCIIISLGFIAVTHEIKFWAKVKLLFNHFEQKLPEILKVDVIKKIFLCLLKLFAATVSLEVEPQPSTVFQKKQGKKTIDVYWLSDDGGLIKSPTLFLRTSRILAHLLKYYSKSRNLRSFFI